MASPTSVSPAGDSTPCVCQPRVFRIAVNAAPSSHSAPFVPPPQSAIARAALVAPDSPLTPVTTPPADSPTSSDGSDSCPVLAVSDAAWDGRAFANDSDDSPQADTCSPSRDDAAAEPQQARSPVRWAPAFASTAARPAARGSGSGGISSVACPAGPPAAPRATPRPFLARPAMTNTPSLKQRQLAKLAQWQNHVRQQSRMHQLCSVPAHLSAVPEDDALGAAFVAPAWPGTGRSPPRRARRSGSGGQRTVVGASGQLQTVAVRGD